MIRYRLIWPPDLAYGAVEIMGYILPDGHQGKPFYVGIGSPGRPARHLGRPTGHNLKSEFIRLIQGAGSEVVVETLPDTTPEEAAQWEVDEINKWGKIIDRRGGILTNMRPGGLPKPFRTRIPQSDEANRKRGISMRAAWHRRRLEYSG